MRSAEGHTFVKPDDILLDTYYAQQTGKHAGDGIERVQLAVEIKAHYRTAAVLRLNTSHR